MPGCRNGLRITRTLTRIIGTPPTSSPCTPATRSRSKRRRSWPLRRGRPSKLAATAAPNGAWRGGCASGPGFTTATTPFPQTNNGRHAPLRGCARFLHEKPPLAHHLQTFLKSHRPRCCEGRELPKRQPRRGLETQRGRALL